MPYELQLLENTSMWQVSIQTLQQVSNVALWVTTISGAIAVGAGFLSSVAANRAADMIQTDADQRIKEADAKGEAAKKEVARAKQAIAEQEVKAAALEKESALVRLEAENIKQQISWRSLTKAQENALLLNAFANHYSINIRYADGDPEALGFALQFERLFRNAGWQVGMGVIKTPNVLLRGLIINIRDDQPEDEMASFLERCSIKFSRANIADSAVQQYSTFVSGPTLIVGSKEM